MAAAIGIDEVLAGHREAFRGGGELMPIARPVDREQRAHLVRGLVSDPAQREGAPVAAAE